MPRGRAPLAAVMLLAGLAACGDGARPPSQAAFRSSAGSAVEETTTTAAPGPTTTAPVVKGTTTTSTPPGTTTTTARAAGATGATTLPVGPRALSPPAAGTYRYTTSGQTVVAGSTVVFPAVTTLIVDPASGTRQHSTRNLRDGSGNGTATELNLDYRTDGVYLVGLRLTTGFAGMTDVRDPAPSSPVLLLATGARPGAHLESTLTAGGGSARLVVDVLGGERLTIGGKAVDTLLMRATVILPPGDVTGRQELTVNVDPGSRLWVREHGVADASAAGGLFTLHSDYTATLQRLTP